MKLVMHLSFAALLVAGALQGQLHVTPVPMDGAPFLRAFNEAEDEARLIVIFSPTCGHCLQVCADLQDILERFPDARIRVLLVWAPIEAGDNLGEARRAALTYIPDPRVTHFWDVWRFGSRAYSERLRLPVPSVWGVLLFFEPGIRWEDDAPGPTFWHQSRGLQVGAPYNRRGFERRLGPWLEP
jgi:hypothetical protein